MKTGATGVKIPDLPEAGRGFLISAQSKLAHTAVRDLTWKFFNFGKVRLNDE